MAAQKQSNPPAGKPPAAGSKTRERKPWRKRSPLEVIIAQKDRLSEQVRDKEAELQALKEQLSKFEEVVKVFQK